VDTSKGYVFQEEISTSVKEKQEESRLKNYAIIRFNDNRVKKEEDRCLLTSFCRRNARIFFDTDPDALWAAVDQDLQDLKYTIDAILEEEEK